MALKDQKYKYRILQDQHGRRWGANIDLAANDAIGVWKPIGWSAPWYPDVESVRMRTDEETGQSRVHIDYDKMAIERKFAYDEWIKVRDRHGHALHGERYDPSKPTLQVLHAAGPAPKPVEPVIAAKNGDEWVLGRSQEMPAWAIPFFSLEAVDETKFMRDAEARVKRGQKPKKLEQALAGV